MKSNPTTEKGWLKLKTGESFLVTLPYGYTPKVDSFTERTIHFFRLRGWNLKQRSVTVQGSNIAYVISEE